MIKLNSNQLENIEYYFEVYNNNIKKYIDKINFDEEDLFLKNKLFEDLILLKSRYFKFFIDDANQKKYNNNQLKENKNLISLVKKVFLNYEMDLNDNKIKEIIDVTISGASKLNRVEIRNYIKKINHYKDNQNSNNLYNFSFISNKKINLDKFKSEHQKVFEESLQKIRNYEKSEFYSQLSIFLEVYLKTPLGKKHIEILDQKYLEDINNKNNSAEKNYLLSILSIYNASTPTKNNINIQNNEIIIKNFRINAFDNLVFINEAEIPLNKKEQFNLIKTLEDLEKFKHSILNVSKFKIVSIGYKGLHMNSDSVIKHFLYPLIITKILNLYYLKESKNNNIIKNFNFDIKINEFNNKIQLLIIKSIKKICPELISYLLKNNENIENKNFFRIIQNEINENPVLFIDYLNNKYCYLKEEQNLIRNNIELTKDDIDSFNNLEEKFKNLKNKSPLFNTKSYLSLFTINDLYKNISCSIDLDSNFKKQKISTNETIMLVKYETIINTGYLGSERADNKSIIQLVDNFLNLRGIGLENKYNNKLLGKFKIEDIEKLILENFLFNNKSLLNINNINETDLTNISESINVYYINTKNDQERIKIFEKIKEYYPSSSKWRKSFNINNKMNYLENSYFYIKENEKNNKRIEDHKKEMEELDKKIEELNKKIEEQDKRLREIRESEKKPSMLIELAIGIKFICLLEEQLKNEKEKEYFDIFLIKNIHEMLKNEKVLLGVFNKFLKDNNLYDLNLEIDYNVEKSIEIIKEIEKILINKNEINMDITQKTEYLFNIIKTKIENKEILEIVKNNKEAYKETYPEFWNKLCSINFEQIF